MHTAVKTTAVAVLAAVSLAACADLPFSYPGERAAVLKPGEGSILFNADVAGNQPVRRIMYSDNEQRVEYALYKGNGAQAEFIYMERPYNLNVAFNYAYTIADNVAHWNYSKGQPVQWETAEAAYVKAKVGDIFLRPYRLTAKNQECFGMSGEWDMASDDPMLRYTRIMWGYYCAPAGDKMSHEKMMTLVDGIGLKGISVPARDYADTLYGFHRDVVANYAGKQGTLKAIEMAQSGSGDSAGVDQFPFRFAEYYDPHRGDDSIDD